MGKKAGRKDYTDEEVYLWHELYKNETLPVRRITEKFNIVHSTLMQNFRRLNLPVRPAGFRANNSRGLYGRDKIRDAYLWFMNHAYKRRAVRKGLEFSLTDDEFIEIVTSDCYYCGALYNSETRSVYARRELIPMLTVDRVDSKLGYIKSNCVSACKQCNTMKMDIPFDKWIQKMRIIISRFGVKD